MTTKRKPGKQIVSDMMNERIFHGGAVMTRAHVYRYELARGGEQAARRADYFAFGKTGLHPGELEEPFARCACGAWWPTLEERTWATCPMCEEV